MESFVYSLINNKTGTLAFEILPDSVTSLWRHCKTKLQIPRYLFLFITK